jgi:hypothetical protein
MAKSTTEDTDDIVYRIDARGRLSYVNAIWDAFAIANDAPELVSSAIVGRPLDDFIADAETRQIVRILVQRVSEGGRPLRLTFQCDAPGERRTLELTIVPIDGGVEFRTRPQNREARGSQRLLDRRSERSSEFLVMCSWCNRARIGDGWFDLEVAVDRLGLFEERALPMLTHGICADCAEQFLAV